MLIILSLSFSYPYHASLIGYRCIPSLVIQPKFSIDDHPMSESPTDTRPCAAYAEDFHEESQCTVPGTRTSSQVRTRKSKRDEASDSGYSSRTPGTSSSSSHKLFKLVSRMAGSKKPSKEAVAPSVAAPKKTVTKMSKKENLRHDTSIESREAAAKIQLSGKPISRTPSNPGHEKSQLHRSTKMGPPPAPIPIKTTSTTRAGLIRPNSYHAGAPDSRYPLHAVQFSAPIHMTRQPPVHHPPPPLSHSYQPQPLMYISVPAPISPSRQTAYPFMPTIPAQHLPMSWESPYHASPILPHVPQPPISRRYSLAGPPPSAPVVQYPVVPHRPVVYQQIEHSRPPVSFHEPQLPYHQVVQDEPLFLDDEAYYRHQEEARRAMPPPQRPSLRHATTVATGLVRQSNRNSMEYVQTPTSATSRAGSFSSIKDQYKAPQMIRTSSSRDVETRKPEMSASADHGKRARPKSFHVGYDRELAAEQYQSEKIGHNKVQPLTTDAIKMVNKSSKSGKSKASETGSRSSDSRKARDARKTIESRKKSLAEPVSVEVDQGCTATVTRDAHGVSVRVRSSEENRERLGRQAEREEHSQRHSLSSRRESLTEATRSILPRRPSSSQPTVRREKLDLPLRTIDMDKRLTDKQRYTDDTAVEDDEYSEPEVLKKRDDKLTAQRLARIKTPSESRPSSRSARSVKSAKSTTSSRRGIAIERTHS